MINVLTHWSRDKIAAIFPDDNFKYIFMNENIQILFKISLNFASEVRINNIPALARIMAWRRPGDKPLSEPMIVNLLTHICITRPQWVMFSYKNTPLMISQHWSKMAWYRQPTIFYLNQYWQSPMTPNTVSRGHWVKMFALILTPAYAIHLIYECLEVNIFTITWQLLLHPE